MSTISAGKQFFTLPGGELRPGESEVAAIRRLLTEYLCPGNASIVDWEVIGSICNLYRPNFDSYMYPYLCAHVTKPKEHKQ